MSFAGHRNMGPAWCIVGSHETKRHGVRATGRVHSKEKAAWRPSLTAVKLCGIHVGRMVRTYKNFFQKGRRGAEPARRSRKSGCGRSRRRQPLSPGRGQGPDGRHGTCAVWSRVRSLRSSRVGHWRVQVRLQRQYQPLFLSRRKAYGPSST